MSAFGNSLRAAKAAAAKRIRELQEMEPAQSVMDAPSGACAASTPSASALVRVLIDGKSHDLSKEQAKKLLEDIRAALGEPERLPPLREVRPVPTTAPRDSKAWPFPQTTPPLRWIDPGPIRPRPTIWM